MPETTYSTLLVTIIIITRNDKAHVGDAINSALAQTYPACEIIVVDDGSEDGTAQYVRDRYADRVSYLNRQNGGMGAARRTGLDHANGEFIQHLDSDDLLLPHKIASQVAYLVDHPELAFVYGRTLCFYDSDLSITWEHDANRLARSGNLLAPILQVGNFVNVCQPLFRRAWLDRVGGWDRFARASDDYEMMVRLAYSGAVGHFLDGAPVFLYRHRRDQDIACCEWRSSENLLRGEIYILEKLKAAMTRDTRDEPALVDERLGLAQFQLGRSLYFQGHRRLARRFMFEGLLRNRSQFFSKALLLGASILFPGPLLRQSVHSLRSSLYNGSNAGGRQ